MILEALLLNLTLITSLSHTWHHWRAKTSRYKKHWQKPEVSNSSITFLIEDHRHQIPQHRQARPSSPQPLDIIVNLRQPHIHFHNSIAGASATSHIAAAIIASPVIIDFSSNFTIDHLRHTRHTCCHRCHLRHCQLLLSYSCMLANHCNHTIADWYISHIVQHPDYCSPDKRPLITTAIVHLRDQTVLAH